MKAWWTTQSARINALSLRERIFLFLSIIACGVVLTDRVWLAPAQLTHQQLTQRFAQQSTALQRARDELKQMGRPLDTVQVARDELAMVQGRLGVVNQRIQASLPQATEGTPMAQVLVHLLHQHEGLTLVRIASKLPDVPAAPNASATPADAAPVALTRYGVTLTVSGAYPDLTRYVQSLEQALPQVRWGVMQLKSQQAPPELTVQLYLVEVPS